MSKEQLTPRQTLLLGQAITAVDLAEKAAEEAEKKISALESSLIGTETPFSEAVTEAAGEIDEVLSNLHNIAVGDFAYENEGERRVARMLRGMSH